MGIITIPQIPECTHEEWELAKRLTDQEAATIILPCAWKELVIPPQSHFYGLRAYQKKGLHVLYSVDPFIQKGKVWLHVSCSRKNCIPSYYDLAEMKQIFVGETRKAVQVFPEQSKHVNIHPYCLHLWSCLSPEGDGLPDFGIHGTI